jgi:2-polyprenyl-6-methoxyphenol hydroxylase-like FAD-dependent oxidoreductase
VGAGPTGLALACELRLAGVDCRVLERRTEEPNITRAFAVHSRTLELLDARWLADQLVPQGIVVTEVAPAPGAVLSLRRELHNRYPMLLIVAQSRTEKMLEDRAVELGAKVVRGEEVTGLTQDADGVTLTVNDGETLRAKYVVGTDGAHSAVRRLIGVDFVGKQYETHILLADVQLQRPSQDTLFGDSWFRAITWDRSSFSASPNKPRQAPACSDGLRIGVGRRGAQGFSASASRRAPIGSAAFSWPATRPTCTRRSAGRA